MLTALFPKAYSKDEGQEKGKATEGGLFLPTPFTFPKEKYKS